MDNPSTVLYWVLAPGQRQDIADRFGASRADDRQQHPDERQRSLIWLQRLHRSGSLGTALRLAARFHQFELRRLEHDIRAGGAQIWRQRLEQTRELHYRLLSFSP